jgi:CSLREA domain-containing protein
MGISKWIVSATILSVVLGWGWADTQLPIAHAQTITVNTTEDELNTDGDCSLREAIQAANLNVAVDACPAGENSNTDIIDALNSNTIMLAGANEDANATGDFDILNNSATLDIEIRAYDINTNHLDRAFHIHSGTKAIIIVHQLINGQADYGGAIYNAGDLTIYAENIFDCIAFNSGGAIYNTDMLYFSGTLGTDEGQGNLAVKGGGIFSTGVTASVTLGYDTEILYNSATDGGGIYNESGSFLIRSGSFINYNGALQNGGGIFNGVNGNMSINDARLVSENTALNGGGFYNQGVAQVSGDIFWDFNTANTDGGGFYNQGTLTLDEFSIHTNSAQRGGGIFNDYGNIIIGTN